MKIDNWSQYIDEISASEMVMKTDPKLPNLKLPSKGKKGTSKFMRLKAVTQAKKESVSEISQAAQNKPPVLIKSPKSVATMRNASGFSSINRFKKRTPAMKEAQRLDPKCWDGYRKKGTKMKGGVRVNNCVKENETPKSDPVTPGYMSHMKKVNKGEVNKYPNRGKGIKKFDAKKFFGSKSKASVKMSEDDMKGMSVSSGHKRSVDAGAGMTQKGVNAYKRKNPGSKLSTAVTTPPSKLKKGSKAAGRRKSFCARSRSWTGERGKAARRRWNC